MKKQWKKQKRIKWNIKKQREWKGRKETNENKVKDRKGTKG